MTKNRQVVRKIPSPAQQAIDEQFWPVMLALFILSGFLMGTVAAYLPFGAKRWWSDARTWLFVIPVVTCVATWLLRYLPSRAVRRTLQVSLVLCLLFHVCMLVVSLESRIFNSLWQRNATNQPRRQQRELRIVNDYQPHQLDQHQRRQQDFVKPVETAVPEPVQEVVARQEPQPEQTPALSQPMPAPRTPRDIQQQAIERPTPAETKPRQSEQASKLSRQQAETKPQRAEPIRIPSTAASTARASQLEARSESLRQRTTETQASQRQTTTEPAATLSRETATLAPRASERNPNAETPNTDPQSAPTLTRQLAQPTNVPRADVRTGDLPSIAKQTSPTELEAARTTSRQQLTTSPRAAQVAEPVPTPATTVIAAPTPRREQPSPSQPQLARTPTPAASRQPRATTRPDVATSAPTVVANATPLPAGNQNIEAQSSTVARSTTSTNPAPAANSLAGLTSTSPAASAPATAARATANSQPTMETAAAPVSRIASAARASTPTTAITAPPPTPMAGTEAAASLSLAGGSTGLQQRLSLMSAAAATVGPLAPAAPAAAPSVPQANVRAQTSTEPTGQPAGASANPLARAARRSELATSTTLSDVPRAVTADAGGDQLQARPSRLAMSASLSGIAGVGQTANLDRSPSTPGSPATTASGSARRAESVQNAPAGPALAPSATSTTRRSLVGTDRPSSSLRATTSSVAEAAGTERPTELNATSGASLVRQNANATPGEMTAAKGSVEIDLGPTRVADAGGFERASGGGQPEVNLEQDSANLARARSGGMSPLALSTTAVDVTAASPSRAEDLSSNDVAAGDSTMQQSETSLTGDRVPTSSELAAAMGSEMGRTEQVTAGVVARADVTSNPLIGDAPGSATSAEGKQPLSRHVPRTAMIPPGVTSGVAVPPGVSAPSVSEAAATGAAGLAEARSGSATRQATAGGILGRPGPADQVAASAVIAGGDAVGEPTVQRAETADAMEGPALPGGGTESSQRQVSGRELVANLLAEMTSLEGTTGSSGSAQGTDAATQGTEPMPTVAGVVGRPLRASPGAVAGEFPRDAVPPTGLGPLAGIAPRSVRDGDSPAIGAAPSSAAPLNRSAKTRFNAATAVAGVAGVPTEPISVATEEAELKEAAMGDTASSATQQSAAAVAVELPAPDGPGGLGDRLALDVGVNSRLSSPDSVEVQTTPSRFLRQEVGGAPQLDTSAIFAADAFRRRTPSSSETARPGGAGASGPQTEEAVERGLSFLARRQLSDGSWTLRSTTEPVQLASDTAATGLCLLAFQGAGYNHREHQYATRIAAALDYLVKNQKPDGDLFVPVDDVSNRSVWLYSHGIAAIALCEAYGMTHDPKLREPAQKALDFISATQDPRGGGWRYQPGVESDTSVSGWMMMALKSGQLAGLKVPQSTYNHIERWLDAAQGSAEQKYLYRYNPRAPNTDAQRQGRVPTSTMTAVGLLMRLYGGWRRDHPAMVAGAEHLQQNLPKMGTDGEPLRDTYYWYYGTQVMFHMGGSYWDDWNGQLHPLLIDSQVKEGELSGSWSPRSPVPDRWAPHAGRLYVTTMNLLSLEVTYRHLPLYVDTGK